MLSDYIERKAASQLLGEVAARFTTGPAIGISRGVSIAAGSGNRFAEAVAEAFGDKLRVVWVSTEDLGEGAPVSTSLEGYAGVDDEFGF